MDGAAVDLVYPKSTAIQKQIASASTVANCRQVTWCESTFVEIFRQATLFRYRSDRAGCDDRTRQLL